MNRRVLLVEDDAHTAAFARAALRRHVNLGMTHVATIADALTAIRNGVFELIVLDLNLPDADGVQAVHAIRAATTLPILVSSSAHERESASIEAGATAFLPKVDEDAPTFAQAVQSLLGSHTPPPQTAV